MDNTATKTKTSTEDKDNTSPKIKTKTEDKDGGIDRGRNMFIQVFYRAKQWRDKNKKVVIGKNDGSSGSFRLMVMY